jgi:Ca2+-binding EF-hand superfamily protein
VTYENLTCLAQKMKELIPTIPNNKKYMKTKLLITMPLFLSTTLFGTPDLKDNDERTSFPIRDHILNRFDSDGDGKLSKNERSEMSKRMQGRKEQLMQKFDANGDGTLNDEEWSKIRKAFQERKAKAFKTLNTDGAKSSDQV